MKVKRLRSVCDVWQVEGQQEIYYDMKVRNHILSSPFMVTGAFVDETSCVLIYYKCTKKSFDV